MKTLVTEEWLSVCNRYTMQVTSELVTNCYNLLVERYNFVDNATFTLTEQDIIDAWTGDYYYDSCYQGILKSVLVKGWKDVDFFEPMELGDLLHDILNDTMWDQPSEECGCTTEEFTDSVECEE